MAFDVSVIVAVIIALNEFLKKVGVPAKVIPIITLGLGAVAGFFFIEGTTIQEKIFNGITIGLAANGLFDLTKIIKVKKGGYIKEETH